MMIKDPPRWSMGAWGLLSQRSLILTVQVLGIKMDSFFPGLGAAMDMAIGK